MVVNSSEYQWTRVNFGDKLAADIAAGAMNTLEKPSEAMYPEASKELCTVSMLTTLESPARTKRDASEFRMRSTPYSPRRIPSQSMAL